MATFSGPFENDSFTGPGVYQAVNGIRCEIDAIAPGTVTIEAIIAPLINSSFQVTVNNPNRNDITFNSTDGFNPISGPAVVVFSFTTNLKRFSIGYTFSGSVWELSHLSKLDPDTVSLSEDVAIAGTTEVELFQCVRYDPAAGGMAIEAPLDPLFRDKFGICNMTSGVTPITFDGNGKDLQDTSYNLVASFVSTAPNARATWEYDGTAWALIDQGGGLLTGTGNQADISRPFNGTSDVNYPAGFSKVEQFTAESSGTGLDADFATNQITIAKQGLFHIEGQCTLAGKTGSRTDLSIAIDGVQTEDRWVAQGTGLTEPVSFQPTIAELSVSSPPVVVTLEVSNDAAGNRTVRHFGLRLSVMEL